MIDAYPLTWPEGWKRTPDFARKRAKFSKGERRYSSDGQNSWQGHRDVTIGEGTNRVLDSLARFGVRSGAAIISTNLQLRNDGLPRSGQRAPDDPGVAVYWERKGDKSMKCMAIDRYDRVADNLAAIAATLEAMRAIERHGGAAILDRAFTGFTALPAPGQTTARGWREVLGFSVDTTPSRELLDERYKSRRSMNHPDKGGTAEDFNAVQIAYEQATQEIRQ